MRLKAFIFVQVFYLVSLNASFHIRIAIPYSSIAIAYIAIVSLCIAIAMCCNAIVPVCTAIATLCIQSSPQRDRLLDCSDWMR